MLYGVGLSIQLLYSRGMAFCINPKTRYVLNKRPVSTMEVAALEVELHLALIPSSHPLDQ